MSMLRKLIASRAKPDLGSVPEDGSDDIVGETATLSVSDRSEEQFLLHFEAVRKETFPVIEEYSVNGATLHTYYRPPAKDPGAVLVCHHGAGSSAMTFCQLTRYLLEEKSNQNPSIGLFAYDARGHGKSSATDDFSREQLTRDFGEVLSQFVHKNSFTGSLYLLGHSLGGSVLTHYLNTRDSRTFNIKGLVMLDIVEETANTSLAAMPQFIEKRPPSFDTYAGAINWHLQTRLLYNADSAKMSVPDLFHHSGDALQWTTDLRSTVPFWPKWFTDLSASFVECGKAQQVAKLLILAGHETLDTNLIIGQMQGKYQLIVFNNSERTGHFVHEDIPMQVGLSLIDFVRRNDSPGEYMKNELGFEPKWGTFRRGSGASDA